MLTITRFTRDTALRDMFHQYIKPRRFVTIITIVMMTTIAEHMSNPMRKNVTTKMAATERLKLPRVSCHIVRYCS